MNVVDAKEAVTPDGIDCCRTCRKEPSPVEVVLTPAVNESVAPLAEVRMPAHEPPVNGNVPPNLVVTTNDVPLVRALAGLVSTPGEALEHVNGSHL